MSRMQEMFNQVWAGLASQGFRQSIGTDGMCRYRWHGRRCAVGWLIPDDRYRRGLEGEPVGRPRVQAAIGLVDGMEDTREILEMLKELQHAHDSNEDPGDMERALRGVASEQGLLVPGGDGPGEARAAGAGPGPGGGGGQLPEAPLGGERGESHG